ncbi:MAG: TIGR00282 family metallophosphoesterase [Erysipelotrichaceae bacterium]
MIKVLFFGDIVGSKGRKIVLDNVAKMKEEYGCDLVIANGENAAHGKGITKKIFYQLVNGGIDCITMGNHTFSKKDVFDFIDDDNRLIRPINLLPNDCGNMYYETVVKGKKIVVYNVIGNVFIPNETLNCFDESDYFLKNIKADLLICDFHGEVTSEKTAYAYHFSDQVKTVVGTHTHVQTNDERIINGCAFICDVGMCGPYDSILGRDKKEAVDRFVLGTNTKYQISEEEAMLCAVVITYDDNLQASNIEKIQIRPNIN